MMTSNNISNIAPKANRYNDKIKSPATLRNNNRFMVKCDHCLSDVQQHSMPRHITSKKCILQQLIKEYNESTPEELIDSPLACIKDLPKNLTDKQALDWILEQTINEMRNRGFYKDLDANTTIQPGIMYGNL